MQFLRIGLGLCHALTGKEIYEISMNSGKETNVAKFPTPEELWKKTFAKQNAWNDTFSAVPFEDVNGSKSARYYQEIAINKTMQAIAEGKPRILLTLATGTGKTFIAFQIAWKLFHARWNLSSTGSNYIARRPRILFLADRNILANQAFNAFSAFPEDALVRVNPADIRKKGNVPTNGSIFFTIFQSFMSGPNNTPYYGEYPPDFFDLIVIDGHRRWAGVEMLIKGGRWTHDGVPAILVDKSMPEPDQILLTIVANDGKPLLPLEEAAAYKRLRDTGMTVADIAKRVGKGTVMVSDRLRLLEADESVREALQTGKLPKAMAQDIVRSSKGDKTKQAEMVKEATASKEGRRRIAEVANPEIRKRRVSSKAVREMHAQAKEKSRDGLAEHSMTRAKLREKVKDFDLIFSLGYEKALADLVKLLDEE
jgi:ParB/RepB/Spo0J family partition protein